MKRFDPRRLDYFQRDPGHGIVVAALGTILKRSRDTLFARKHHGTCRTIVALHQVDFVAGWVATIVAIMDADFLGKIVVEVNQFHFKRLAGGDSLR